MANTDSIYALYNDKLTVDQSYVDTIVTAIKAEIATTTAAEETNTFDFDLTSYIGTLQLDQQIRIKDQIIYFFRQIGFRSYIVYNNANTPNVTMSNNFDFAVNFNSKYVTNSLIIRIEWFVRNDREFMKAYV